jgi:hypothetical protein
MDNDIQRGLLGAGVGVALTSVTGGNLYTGAVIGGLFGTVWGIMHAFQEIAIQKSTNLAVVAPAIAEALFATAIGLAAAIPAYIAYNKFSIDAGKFTGRLESFADDLQAAVARRLGAGTALPQCIGCRRGVLGVAHWRDAMGVGRHGDGGVGLAPQPT